MKQVVIAVGMLLVSAPLFAGTPCEEVGAEITAKLAAKGVKGYKLEVVAADKVGEGQKVVGSCDGGKSKLVYSRGAKAAAKAPAPTAAPAATPAAAPAASPPPM